MKTLSIVPIKFLLPLFAAILFLSTSCEKEDVNMPPIVNAGNDTTLTLTASRSLQLDGKAQDKDGVVVAFLWSQLAGPNTAVIANPASASTNVTGLVSGVYTFQLMATDEKGAVGVKTIKITTIPGAVQTLILKPANNANEVLLAYINSTGDASHNNSTQLEADTWTTNGSTHFVRGLFRFDFTGLSSTAVINSARLYLYSVPNPLAGNLVDANFGTANAMLLQRVTTSWVNNVNWMSQPVGDAASQIEVPHTAQRMQDLDIDVTNMVKSMMVSGNYGWLIKLKTEAYYNSRQFASSKYADAAKHPKLVIQYTN